MFGLCILWGLQQVVLKMAAPDISSLMQVALRSGLSTLMVYPLIKLSTGNSLWSKDYLYPGLVVALLFAAEFFMLAQAIRFTSASHAVVLLYTAPIFVALGLHWKLPSERLSILQWGGIFYCIFRHRGDICWTRWQFRTRSIANAIWGFSWLYWQACFGQPPPFLSV